ncbi:hypothetical protein L218DRAFT_1039112, partial [Marasmius fiardii PR-910]
FNCLGLTFCYRKIADKSIPLSNLFDHRPYLHPIDMKNVLIYKTANHGSTDTPSPPSSSSFASTLTPIAEEPEEYNDTGTGKVKTTPIPTRHHKKSIPNVELYKDLDDIDFLEISFITFTALASHSTTPRSGCWNGATTLKSILSDLEYELWSARNYPMRPTMPGRYRYRRPHSTHKINKMSSSGKTVEFEGKVVREQSRRVKHPISRWKKLPEADVAMFAAGLIV